MSAIQKKVVAGSATIIENDQDYFPIKAGQKRNFPVFSYSGLDDSTDAKTGNSLQSDGSHWMAEAAYNQTKQG